MVMSDFTIKRYSKNPCNVHSAATQQKNNKGIPMPPSSWPTKQHKPLAEIKVTETCAITTDALAYFYVKQRELQIYTCRSIPEFSAEQTTP